MWTDASPHHEGARSRRDFLTRAGGGFGAVALAHLLQSDRSCASEYADPREPRQPHVPVRAKSVIFLFMEGGPSHIDMFDPKPALAGLHGKQLPPSFGQVVLPMGEQRSPLLASRRTFRCVGEAGHPVSDWVPYIGEVADDISLLQSCWCDGLNHVGSVCQMNTGSTLAGRPSLGSWTTYGLGTMNQSLPAFVVLADRKGTVAGGPRNWGTGFMSASYQGTMLRNGPEAIANLHPSKGVGKDRQRGKLDFLQRINRRHLEERSDRGDLEARIASYELAFRMQAEAPEAVDLDGETLRTKELYGLDRKHTLGMGRACLLARRLVERGVRFVQVYSGAGSKWDSHSDLEKGHGDVCRSMDRPVAALVRDLKERGLLDETLVVWGGEFGRTPMSEKGNGRDHNPYGFTMWFAGAGVKPGIRVGTTDEVGLHAVDDRAHVFDIHATIFRLMGLDHRQLTFLHNGRVERPTINQGEPIAKLMA